MVEKLMAYPEAMILENNTSIHMASDSMPRLQFKSCNMVVYKSQRIPLRVIRCISANVPTKHLSMPKISALHYNLIQFTGKQLTAKCSGQISIANAGPSLLIMSVYCIKTFYREQHIALFLYLLSECSSHLYKEMLSTSYL